MEIRESLARRTCCLAFVTVLLYLTGGVTAAHQCDTCAAYTQQCLQTVLSIAVERLSPYIDGFNGDIYLFDVATHKNLGDSLLWYGAKRVIRAFKRNPDIICAMTQRDPKHKNFPMCPGPEEVVAASTRRPILLLWHPGGNWGDIWRGTHPRRMKYLERLDAAAAATPNAAVAVVQLPQNIHYINPDAALRDKQVLDSLKHINFTLLHRAERSSEVARDLFGERYTQVVPDLGFLAGPQLYAYTPKYDIFLLLRADHESTVSTKERYAIVQRFFSKPENSRWTWKLGDWENFDDINVPFNGTYADLADLRLEEVGYTLSPGRVVITNRLHATVGSFLMGKPVFFFDGARYADYGKIFTTVSLALNNTQCSDWDRLQLHHVKGAPPPNSVALTEQDILLLALERATAYLQSKSS